MCFHEIAFSSILQFYLIQREVSGAQHIFPTTLPGWHRGPFLIHAAASPHYNTPRPHHLHDDPTNLFASDTRTCLSSSRYRKGSSCVGAVCAVFCVAQSFGYGYTHRVLTFARFDRFYTISFTREGTFTISLNAPYYAFCGFDQTDTHFFPFPFAYNIYLFVLFPGKCNSFLFGLAPKVRESSPLLWCQVFYTLPNSLLIHSC